MVHFLARGKIELGLPVCVKYTLRMTTYADILQTKCCCIRHDPMYPPQLMLLENLLMLIVFITLHYIAFLMGWDNVCLVTLLGVYYGMYQVVVVYCAVNKCYINAEYMLNNDSDDEDDEAEDKTEDKAEDDAEDDAEDHADDHAEDDADDEGEAEDDEDDDMPPLISLNDDTYVYKQLQQVVDDTNARNAQRATMDTNDITKQIKDSLKNLQEMIELAKDRAYAQAEAQVGIPEFKVNKHD